MVTNGEMEVDGWEPGMDLSTLLRLKWITVGDLLHSAGALLNTPYKPEQEENLKRRDGMCRSCMCCAVPSGPVMPGLLATPGLAARQAPLLSLEFSRTEDWRGYHFLLHIMCVCMIKLLCCALERTQHHTSTML